MNLAWKKTPLIVFVLVIVLLAFVFVFFFFWQDSVTLKGGDSEIHGFKLIKQSYVDTIQTTVLEYEHIKSGAKLIYLKNDDDNKTFSVNFRTPPNDNSGVNHVLEHCLLSGSENYPVKSILSTMQSQTMSTFFNAFTDSDVTGYITSSKNEKDFQNLVSVYMDAVLHPNVLRNKNIFLQEAGHYEFDSANSKLSYTGVVYNEVKDGETSPYELLFSRINQSLLPDTVYRWGAGGDSAEIPDLTYEKLVETYQKYYHPSNSYIYLYGNLDITATLNILDSKYLNDFDKKEANSAISLQTPLADSVEATCEYFADGDVSAESKAYLSWSCVLEDASEIEILKAFEIIGSLLFDEGASFKKALSDKGFSDLSYSIGRMRQPIFTLLCESGGIDRKDEFAQAVEAELKRIVENGFDKKDIAALLHSYKIRPYNDSSSTGTGARGVMYSHKVMSVWLYDGDPVDILDYSPDIALLQKALSGNYLEELIGKYMLENVQKAVIALEPQNSPLVETEESRLEKYKKSLSEDQITAIIKQSEDLKKWQAEPDSAEALSRMPVLELSSISKDTSFRAPDSDTVNGMTLLYTPVETNGMNYLKFYFDTSTVSQDKIQYIKLLEALLGRVGTADYDSSGLINELKSSTAGDLRFFSYPYKGIGQTDVYAPKMMVSVSTLDEDIDNTMELLNQILTRSVFNNKQQLHDIIHEQKTLVKNQAASTYMGILRATSYFSDKDNYYENLYGHPYYRFISQLDANFEENSDEILSNITEVYNCIFNKNNLILAFTGTKEEYAIYRGKLKNLLEGMSDSKLTTYDYKFTVNHTNEGLISTQKVNSINMGYNFKKLGYEYSGSMAVLKTILDDYLFTELRGKQGAYGVKTYIDMDGRLLFSTSRDPKILETLNAFKGVPSFLRNFDIDKEKMKNYIIGTISRIDRYINDFTALEDFMMGGTKELFQKERDEILNTTVEDIRALADVVQAVLDKNCFCVAGKEADIKSQEDLFSRIVKLEIPD